MVRAAASAALVQLLGKVPSKAEATQSLYERARNYFQQRLVLRTDADGRATIWQWNPISKQCVSKNCSIEDASRILAARLARDAMSLSPEDRQVRLLSLVAILDDLAYRSGPDKPVDFSSDAGILSLGPHKITAVLEYALASRHPAAARAAVEILGRIGKAQELLRGGVEPAALVRAVRNPDRRLRIAALEAIVRLQPDAPFAGSSHVTESLGFFGATSGVRRAILASPNPESLQEWVDTLAPMHIHPDVAVTAREVMRLALSSPDYELVLIDMGISNPSAEVLVQRLRQDYRTMTLRIGVVARSGFFDRAERIAREDPMTLAFARPHTPEAALWQMNQLALLGTREFVGFQERQQESARALACLAMLASSSKKLYDVQQLEEVITTGMYTSGLGPRIATVLANLGTPESQSALVELASRYTQPLPTRKAAAKAFRLSTQKFGVLLPEDAVTRQYERYRRSESQDMGTQQVLGMVLDSIEARIDTARMSKAAKAAIKAAAAVKPPTEKAKPVEKPKLDEGAKEKPAAKPAPTPAEKPTAKPGPIPAEKPAAKPGPIPAEKPAAKPGPVPAEKPAAKPAEKPKPEAEIKEKPAEKPAAKQAENVKP